MPNDIVKTRPEVEHFLNTHYNLKDDHEKLCQDLDKANAMIATLEDQCVSYREIIKDFENKYEYYMRLSVEMRTHFKALSAMTIEAEKCFLTGPYRNNGAMPENFKVEQSEPIKQEEVEKIPGFLTDEKRNETVEKLKEKSNWGNVK